MRRHFPRQSSWTFGLVAACAFGCNVFSGATEYGVGEDATLPADADASSLPHDAGIQTVAPDDAATDDDGDLDAALPPASKRVFVTQKRMKGAIGSLDAADQECRGAALVAGLRTTKWVAWMSNGSQDAIDRVRDVPYTLVDGTPVVRDKAQLRSGQLLSPIHLTENGQEAPTAPEEVRVWTGTGSDGTATSPDTCLDWTSSSLVDFGVLGFLGSSDASWTRAPGAVQPAGGWGCQTLGRLYCFEL